MTAALDIGYRHFDTAHYYDNEQIIGNILKRWFDTGKIKREELFITTKLPGPGIHPDKVETYLTGSLKKLQLDYVDLYLIHFPIHTTAFDGPTGDFSLLDPLPTDHVATWKKLEEQVDLGRAKSIGLSSFNKAQVARILANSRIKPVANQVELHLYLQQPELVKYCQDNNILVTSYFTLCSPGLDKWLEEKGLAPREFRPPMEDAIVKKIAEKHKKSPAQIALKWAVQNNIAIIPGINPEFLQENIDLFDFKLDAEDLKALKGLDKGEVARMTKLDFQPAFLDHPEYPYPKPNK